MISAHITGFGADTPAGPAVMLTQEQIAKEATKLVANCTKANADALAKWHNSGDALRIELYLKANYPDAKECIDTLSKARLDAVGGAPGKYIYPIYPGSGDTDVLKQAAKEKEIFLLTADIYKTLTGKSVVFSRVDQSLVDALNLIFRSRTSKSDVTVDVVKQVPDTIITALRQVKAQLQAEKSKTNTTVAIIAAAALGGGLILLAMRRAKPI